MLKSRGCGCLKQTYDPLDVNQDGSVTIADVTAAERANRYDLVPKIENRLLGLPDNYVKPSTGISTTTILIGLVVAYFAFGR